MLSNDAEKVAYYCDNMSYSLVTAQNGTREQLEEQVKTFNEKIEEMQKAVNSGAPGVTQAMVDELVEMRRRAKTELDLYVEQFGDAIRSTNEIVERNETVQKARAQARELMQSYKDDTDWWREIGSEMLDGIIEGLNISDSQADKNLAIYLGMYVKRQRELLGIHSPSTVTRDQIGKHLGDGIIEGEKDAILKGASRLKGAMLSPEVIASAQAGTRATANAATAQILTTSNVRNVTNNYNNQNGTRETVIEECKISFERGVNDLVDFLLPKIESAQRRRGKRMVNGVV